MKRTLIGLGLIASLIGGEALAYKGFDYPGKKTHDFQSNPITILMITTQSFNGLSHSW